MKKKDVLSLLRKPASELERFHSKTKMKKMPSNTNPKFWPEEWKKVYYKGYARFNEIILPKPTISSRVSFTKVLADRISVREFSRKPITLKHLSNLFYYSAGINNMHPNKERRFYPSPGGRYAIEAYLISLNTELPRGIYHYYVKNNSFEKMFNFNKKQLRNFVSQPWIEKAGGLIVFTAVFRRNSVKYGDRGYRHVISEAGHVGQNFYLLASALGMGICGVGGYIDDYINEILGVDGVGESVVYLLAVGEVNQ